MPANVPAPLRGNPASLKGSGYLGTI